jgi:hypothetical protein
MLYKTRINDWWNVQISCPTKWVIFEIC